MSEVEFKGNLPGTLGIVRLHLRYHACMESEESSEDNNEGGNGDSMGQHMDEGETRIIDNKDTDTTSERLEDLGHDAILAR